MKQLVILIVVLGSVHISVAQKIVGLDNWFNRETSKKTGQPYHYLWNDTAWSGYSRWGAIFNNNGAKTVHIEKPTAKALKSLSVYIIVDPDSVSETPNPNLIMPDDIKTITGWVKKGGVLVLMGNDAKNCEFTHFNMLASRFGITFDFVSLYKVPKDQWDKGAFVNFSEHPIYSGVNKIFMKEVSSLTLSGNAKPVLSANGLVFAAESTYGKGWVIAIGDPWIYNEYIDHDRLPSDFENRKAAENFTNYLIKISK